MEKETGMVDCFSQKTKIQSNLQENGKTDLLEEVEEHIYQLTEIK
jgi:UTP-glucose-1-phosphate uridylyltransferase